MDYWGSSDGFFASQRIFLFSWRRYWSWHETNLPQPKVQQLHKETSPHFGNPKTQVERRILYITEISAITASTYLEQVEGHSFILQNWKLVNRLKKKWKLVIKGQHSVESLFLKFKAATSRTQGLSSLYRNELLN